VLKLLWAFFGVPVVYSSYLTWCWSADSFLAHQSRGKFDAPLFIVLPLSGAIALALMLRGAGKRALAASLYYLAALALLTVLHLLVDMHFDPIGMH
jgi:hypothetical protein